MFRAHVHFQSDILQYNPSPGDLAYPEKLQMMEVSGLPTSLQQFYEEFYPQKSMLIG